MRAGVPCGPLLLPKQSRGGGAAAPAHCLLALRLLQEVRRARSPAPPGSSSPCWGVLLDQGLLTRNSYSAALGWIDCSTAALQQLECSSRIASSHRSSQQPSAQQFRPDSEAQRGGSHTEGGRGGGGVISKAWEGRRG